MSAFNLSCSKFFLQPPSPGVSLRQDQQNQLPHGPLASQTRTTGQGSKTKGASVVQPKHEGQFHCTWITPQQQTDHHPESPFPQHDGKFQSPWVLPPQPQGHPRQIVQSMTGNPMYHQCIKIETVVLGWYIHGIKNVIPGSPTVQRVPQAQFSGMPRPVRTKPITWLGAVFCTIFYIVIFIGGPTVLVVYLVYRSRSPRFDVSSATSASIDAGSQLDADLSVLANQTNPNRKVSVDFSYLIIDLYYGSTLIASQGWVKVWKCSYGFYSGSASRNGKRAASEQISINRVLYDVKGVFRVRSKLGSLLLYSYRLYGHCIILVTSPPSGVLRATKCRTKRW
jgi:hypothetical protein